MRTSERCISERTSASSGRRSAGSLDMKHSLQLKLSQHLTLTPQLQQSIRLLQLSTVELNQELERYLAENPLLERADQGAGDEAATAQPLPPGTAPEPTTVATPQEEPRDEPSSF